MSISSGIYLYGSHATSNLMVWGQNPILVRMIFCSWSNVLSFGMERKAYRMPS